VTQEEVEAGSTNSLSASFSASNLNPQASFAQYIKAVVLEEVACTQVADFALGLATANCNKPAGKGRALAPGAFWVGVVSVCVHAGRARTGDVLQSCVCSQPLLHALQLHLQTQACNSHQSAAEVHTTVAATKVMQLFCHARQQQR
jgi:hypothetical protein